MDVKTGGAAFMRDLALAEDLAASIRNVALLAGLPLHVLFTRMDRPLGRAAGNWVEVVEAEQALASRTTASADLVEVTVELVAHMLLLGGLCTSLAGARTQVVGEWDTGRPHAAFHGMLQRQGGDYDAGVQRHATALQRILTTSTDGYVQHIDGMPVAMAVLQAGGGRLKETDSIDPDVGVEVVTTVGAHLKRGEATFKLSATTMDQLDRMEQTLQSAVHMATAPVEPEPSMILQRWT
jgi:thymidine phosphorylase